MPFRDHIQTVENAIILPYFYCSPPLRAARSVLWTEVWENREQKHWPKHARPYFLKLLREPFPCLGGEAKALIRVRPGQWGPS